MHKIPGFEILEKIKEGSTAVIYRARKNDATYILKVMATEYPSQYELARFLNEYETLRQIQSDVIIRAEEILENENSIILVLEDFQGRSLKEVYAHRSIEISEFLKVAISISLALEAIHSRGISHRDLKPQNILINPNTGQLKVTDFGLSSLQAPETGNGHKAGILEGTLPYISPEQTGRMNREADYRTDFYSLGVTLYELLTGLLPFPAEDPLEIIHSHLAIVPPNPRSIRADVFPVLSKILMKLLAKIPDQRYQSAVGLRADLERCLAEFEAGGSVPDFAVGMHEANTFRIPQRLYGREEELQDLLHAFHRASEGARELVVVNGPSGIGKTALVSELREPLSRKDGYFLWGKFEELKRDIPYSAIIAAFRGLIRSLLSESHDRLTRWRKSIQTALDQNGQLIVNVIPELELILGKQPPIPEVSPAEAQNRFSYTIQEFVRVFADETHPLAIFLDDIQWADRASLNLLEWITLNPDLTHFLAIVSYREKSASPFVLECLDSIVSRGGTVREIALKPLEQSALRELLSETFSRDDGTVQSLALQLVKRTGGNPFFVREFLRTLQERSLIYIQNEWKWDMDLIERSGITENVAELLTGRIDHLPDPTIESLTLGATIGNRFSLDELSEVQEIPARQIFANLKPALDEGFLTVDGSTLVFVHDRVREAAYELLSPADRDRLHYRIGVTRLANLTEATDDETIFGIVNQLGAGKSCILDSGERAQLVALALRAAQAARSAAAFRSAVDYLNLAVEFLPEDPWNTNYHQTLMVYTDLAESQYSSTNFEEAQRLFALVLSRARTVLDKVRIFQMQVESLVPQNRLAEAIESARSSLKQLGLAIPARAGKFTALPGLLWVKRKIGKNIEELAQLPEMTDPQDLAKMHLLMQTIAPAFIANPNLFPVLLLKMVNMTLQKGLCPESAYAFAGLGLIFGAALGDYDSGYRLGNVARSVLEKHKSGQMLCKVLFIHGNMIHHWTRPSRESQEILLESYTSGIESGELQFAAYSCNWFNAYNLLIRTDLRTTLDSMERTENTMRKFRQKDQYYFYSMWRQFATQLTDAEALRPTLSGSYFEESEIVPEWIESRNYTDLFGFHLSQCIMNYLSGDFSSALESSKKAWGFQSGVFGMAVVPELNFFESLSLAGMARHTKNRWIGHRAITRIKRNQRKMKVWARHCPENYECKHSLVQAELAALQGRHSEAIERYNDSIRSATQNQFRLENALANRLCAQFFLTSGMARVAESYLREAHYSFQRFGISYLSRQLEEEFPVLFGRHRNIGSLTVTGEQTYTGDSLAREGSNPEDLPTANQFLDLRTVLRCTQAISGEIFLDQLIEKLMSQVIENAGAERCYLFLPGKEDLLLAAAVDVTGKLQRAYSKTSPAEPLSSLQEQLSVGIVQYCQRTGEHVILDNAIESGPFTADPYIQMSRSKSVLCMPVQKGALLVGILYMENNVLSHVFTPGRLELLRILASQAAISIENARLAREEADRASALTEMQLARDVQLSILPRVPEDPAYRLSAFMQPAAQVGGDYYDFVRKNNMRWFAIGDVAGHGLYSGLVMLMAQTGFGMYLKSRDNPDLLELYTTLNAQLHDNVVQRTGKDVYMTLTVFCADESGLVRYTGKHQDLLVYRAQTETIEVHNTEGVWLGILPDIAATAEASTIQLNPGDMLILYSDGVLECRNASGEQFDTARLMAAIQQYAPDGPEAVQSGIRKACFDFLDKQDDDLTVMVIQKK